MNYYQERERKLEREGVFDADIRPYTYDDAVAIDENYRYFFNGAEKFFHAVICALVYLILRPVLFFGCGYRIRGKKKIKGIKSAIVVSNHVHYLDAPMVEPLHSYFRYYHTGAAFNAKRGIRGEFLKLIGFLPLNGSFGAQKNLMKRIEDILSRGGYVHFYPEHALWHRYEKPRPFKSGAFKYAAKFSVPVVPAFITFEETKFRKLFRMKKRCVLHVLDPVYPREELSQRENAEFMKRKCFSETAACYERVYGVPLTYEK